MTGEAEAATVCVTGAAGFIGSWLVMRLLERGYNVHATVRDPDNMKKVKHLLELPKANSNLKLWKADMNEEGSFDKAIEGCAGVFHVATPMDFESKDPENEVIKPTVRGALSIIDSCVKAKTVKRLVFTSSAGTVDVKEQQEAIYDEASWSDLEFIHEKKMTGWMYFVSKTLAEKALCKVAKENNIDFISIIPTVVVGPFITPTFPPSLITALSPITGNEAHYPIIKQGQYVHLDDLCDAHIFLYEHHKAEGTYICSSHEATIYGLAEMIREKWPEYNVPAEFEGIDKNLPIVCFSSKKLLHMGYQFKYSLEDMYQEAISTCHEKGFLPYSFKDQINGKETVTLPKSTEKPAEEKDILPKSTEEPAVEKDILPKSTEKQAGIKQNGSPEGLIEDHNGKILEKQ